MRLGFREILFVGRQLLLVRLQRKLRLGEVRLVLGELRATPASLGIREVLLAAVSAAFAEVRFCWACVALIVASCSPVVTLSPTATFTAVSVPLVEKLSDVVDAELTLAEAVSVDWIVPRATVAVRVAAAGVALLA